MQLISPFAVWLYVWELSYWPLLLMFWLVVWWEKPQLAVDLPLCCLVVCPRTLLLATASCVLIGCLIRNGASYNHNWQLISPCADWLSVLELLLARCYPCVLIGCLIMQLISPCADWLSVLELLLACCYPCVLIGCLIMSLISLCVD